MILNTKLKEPLPKEVLKKLAAVGISSDDVHRVVTEFQEAQAMTELAYRMNITKHTTPEVK